ncbi:unnamed protein product [Heligmosomoides polygyrus]|uniref:Arf-GAP domain-containing protein n=1 Tax=Heligmosomoides polygyrus TaxID=6339 RepID=A0A3P7ZAG1_HELPZ|nr:unnamed protein product [Heligmosomoides polygyrus]
MCSCPHQHHYASHDLHVLPSVFLCIDCSATHRNLGVHLTFVRSTNLDVNWTWLQLRAMQVGGNANATQFFKQHGCNSNDAQIKYKSRAAQLYKEKLAQLCIEVQNKYGNTVFIDTAAVAEEHKEEDFFSQDFVHASQSATSLSSEAYIGHDTIDSRPKVDHIDSEAVPTSAPVSIILKKPVKKAGANKKSGLGAQKVRIDFDELEQRAAEREKTRVEVCSSPCATSYPGLPRCSLRPKYCPISGKFASILDPQKAAAADRLGMAGFGRPRAAHSVAQGVKPIRQVGFDCRLPRVKVGKNDDDLFTTDYTTKSKTDFFDSWDEQPEKRNSNSSSGSRKPPPPVAAPKSDVDIQKKFAGAKAISSEMYFGNNEMDYETKAALSRFEGQTSLGSADLWGQGSQPQYSQVPEMSDIKDSLRAGASKVAEKFSSLSTSFSSYMSVSWRRRLGRP